MLSAFILLVAPPATVDDACDVLEINHVCSQETGEEHFTQLIAWDFERFEGRYQVCDWRFLKRNERPARYGDKYRVTFQDTNDQWRTVTAPAYRETWTTWDVELLERDTLKPCQRRGFTK